MTLLHAIILGIVEGLTEFLPISSTGHLILTAKLLGLTSEGFLATFEVVIQLGAILAVVVMYFKRFLTNWNMNMKLVVGLIPAVVVGGVFYPFIKSLFASPLVVVVSLFVGGVAIILIERYQVKQVKTVENVDEISYKLAFLIGCFQTLAVVPGVSRAGATIMGGLLLGMERRAIVEFSFLLAVPTMLAASAKDMLESSFIFTSQEFTLLGVGFVTAFVVALAVMRWLLSFVQTNTFVAFGWYRIVAAILFFVIVLM